jgi:hypothetical protein
MRPENHLVPSGKCHPFTYDQNSEKARVYAERRSVAKLIAQQKYEKARVKVKRWGVVKLTAKQRCEKARVEVERRIGESSQAAIARLIDKRNFYTTRLMTVGRGFQHVWGDCLGNDLD